MLKIITFINLVSFSLILTGCQTRQMTPRPVLQTSTQQTAIKTVSLGTLIGNSNQSNKEVSYPIIQESDTYDENKIYSREEEDNEMNNEEEYTPTIVEEDIPSELVTIKEESTTEIEELEETSSTVAINVDHTQSSKVPVQIDPYGNVPENYREKIRNYLSKKANPAYSLKYIFSRPQKAYKNDKSWRGWMVQVDVLKRNGKGKILKNQPYTILFNNSTILEEISNDHPKNITKVIY